MTDGRRRSAREEIVESAAALSPHQHIGQAEQFSGAGEGGRAGERYFARRRTGTGAQPAGQAGKYLAGALDVTARKLWLLAGQPDAVEEFAEVVNLLARKRDRCRTGRGSGVARPGGHGLQ
jgi:hypothetical protein